MAKSHSQRYVELDAKSLVCHNTGRQLLTSSQPLQHGWVEAEAQRGLEPSLTTTPTKCLMFSLIGGRISQTTFSHLYLSWTSWVRRSIRIWPKAMATSHSGSDTRVSFSFCQPHHVRVVLLATLLAGLNTRDLDLSEPGTHSASSR
jgi:hypothetical protein